mgnify:CR=1 FL=1
MPYLRPGARARLAQTWRAMTTYIFLLFLLLPHTTLSVNPSHHLRYTGNGNGNGRGSGNSDGNGNGNSGHQHGARSAQPHQQPQRQPGASSTSYASSASSHSGPRSSDFTFIKLATGHIAAYLTPPVAAAGASAAPADLSAPVGVAPAELLWVRDPKTLINPRSECFLLSPSTATTTPTTAASGSGSDAGLRPSSTSRAGGNDDDAAAGSTMSQSEPHTATGTGPRSTSSSSHRSSGLDTRENEANANDNSKAPQETLTTRTAATPSSATATPTATAAVAAYSPPAAAAAPRAAPLVLVQCASGVTLTAAAPLHLHRACAVMQSAIAPTPASDRSANAQANAQAASADRSNNRAFAGDSGLEMAAYVRDNSALRGNGVGNSNNNNDNKQQQQQPKQPSFKQQQQQRRGAAFTADSDDGDNGAYIGGAGSSTGGFLFSLDGLTYSRSVETYPVAINALTGDPLDNDITHGHFSKVNNNSNNNNDRNSNSAFSSSSNSGASSNGARDTASASASASASSHTGDDAGDNAAVVHRLWLRRTAVTVRARDPAGRVHNVLCHDTVELELAPQAADAEHLSESQSGAQSESGAHSHGHFGTRSSGDSKSQSGDPSERVVLPPLCMLVEQTDLLSAQTPDTSANSDMKSQSRSTNSHSDADTGVSHISYPFCPHTRRDSRLNFDQCLAEVTASSTGAAKTASVGAAKSAVATGESRAGVVTLPLLPSATGVDADAVAVTVAHMLHAKSGSKSPNTVASTKVADPTAGVGSKDGASGDSAAKQQQSESHSQRLHSRSSQPQPQSARYVLVCSQSISLTSEDFFGPAVTANSANINATAANAATKSTYSADHAAASESSDSTCAVPTHSSGPACHVLTSFMDWHCHSSLHSGGIFNSTIGDASSRPGVSASSSSNVAGDFSLPRSNTRAYRSLLRQLRAPGGVTVIAISDTLATAANAAAVGAASASSSVAGNGAAATDADADADKNSASVVDGATPAADSGIVLVVTADNGNSNANTQIPKITHKTSDNANTATSDSGASDTESEGDVDNSGSRKAAVAAFSPQSLVSVSRGTFAGKAMTLSATSLNAVSTYHADQHESHEVQKSSTPYIDDPYGFPDSDDDGDNGTSDDNHHDSSHGSDTRSNDVVVAMTVGSREMPFVYGVADTLTVAKPDVTVTATMPTTSTIVPRFGSGSDAAESMSDSESGSAVVYIGSDSYALLARLLELSARKLAAAASEAATTGTRPGKGTSTATTAVLPSYFPLHPLSAGSSMNSSKTSDNDHATRPGVNSNTNSDSTDFDIQNRLPLPPPS